MKKKKLVACLFLVLILVTVFNPLTIKAAINTSYGQEVRIDDTKELPGAPTLLAWIGEMVFTVANGVENIGARIMKIFTGNNVFPYSDKIIFNTIPILDVNFINPANGSFFKDVNGKWTEMGKIVRNMYFSVLAISLSFLTIIIGVVVLRLAISTIASEKAKYKEAIINFLTCIILLFGLHYLLSCTFYINEKLVEVASSALTFTLSNQGDEYVQSLQGLADESNEEIALNFTDVASEKCFLSKIPIVGTLYQGLLDTIHAIGNVIGKAWKWLTGGEDDVDEISREELGRMYPNKEDYIKALTKSGEVRLNVMAYLLKNEYYRRTYLQWIKGNDTNSLNKGGLTGVGRNILIAINGVFGVADTGYKALRTLYTSVLYITFKPGETDNDNDGQPDDLPFKSVLQEAQDENGGNPKKTKIDTGNVDDEGKKIYSSEDLEDTRDYTLDKGAFIANEIKSTEDYYAYKDAVDKELDRLEKSTKDCNEKIDKLEKKKEKSGLSIDEQKELDDAKDQVNSNDEAILACNLNNIYADAYYKYVYDGDDKVLPKTSEMLSELGSYFKQSSWYVDTEHKGWAPTAINFISAFCYAVFIVQSLLFFIAYAKRFFYVIILSLLGPIVVVFDYLSKSI